MKVLLAFLLGLSGLTARAQNLLYQDHIYEDAIRTVLFYPIRGEKTSLLDFPVVYLNETESLMLEFDELGDQYHNFNFKVLHCNHDWTPSILNDFEFLEGFNEFSIDNYEISLNTRNAYVHYALKIPRLKVTGNYVVKVYRNMNPAEPVLTRRFVVYENKVGVTIDPKFPLDPSLRFSGQQIDFSILYGDYPIFNPRETVKVTLRQNGRWDNANYNLKPLFIRDSERVLDYHYYNNENLFAGLNEYRGFDMRSIRFTGQNMAVTRFDNQRAEAWLMPDKNRNQKNLSQWIDLNGRFVIDNFETRRGHVEADYIDTYFTLENETDPDGDIYLFGLMTDWEIKPEFRMEKQEEKNVWKGHTKLKQGFYNYSYVVVNPGLKPNETRLEGSHSQTENRYDVLVYFRPIGSRYDHVIGYSEIDYNKLR